MHLSMSNPTPLPRGLAAGLYKGFDSAYNPTPEDIDVKSHVGR